LIETVGRSGRVRVRAQNRAISIESAPRSSKKWLSCGTSAVASTSASIVASRPANPPTGAPRPPRAGAVAGARAAGSPSAVASAVMVVCR
jgi:hypothetical protein